MLLCNKCWWAGESQADHDEASPCPYLAFRSDWADRDLDDD